jgi:hypothetical protein
LLRNGGDLPGPGIRRVPLPVTTSPEKGVAARLIHSLLTAILVAFTACEDSVELVRPSPGNGGGGGGVQRADFTVVVTLGPEDASLADALEFEDRRVPDAEVTIRRTGESATSIFVSDEAGRVTVEGLLPGNYVVSVLRLLTESERELLVAAEGDLGEVSALGGSGARQVRAPADSLDLTLIAGSRGSLVISEVFNAQPLSGNTFYFFGGFIELYNNADTTIYLDGKILAKGMWRNHENSVWPCDAFEKWRFEEEGIWSAFHVRFPGSGSSYPVEPGEAVVVAQSAIDHRQFGEGMLDLRGADFEYVGPANVDNPAVPNVEDVGPHPWIDLANAGLYVTVLLDILLLVDPVDLESLERDVLPDNYPNHVMIPADRILDVATFSVTPERAPATFQTCAPTFTHPRFDRGYAQLLDFSNTSTSIQRRILAPTPDGRAILQHTRTSAADFHRRPPSPGAVP